MSALISVLFGALSQARSDGHMIVGPSGRPFIADQHRPTAPSGLFHRCVRAKDDGVETLAMISGIKLTRYRW
jgi:hypothetical protein